VPAILDGERYSSSGQLRFLGSKPRKTARGRSWTADPEQWSGEAALHPLSASSPHRWTEISLSVRLDS
jgi:hypothetical protein